MVGVKVAVDVNVGGGVKVDVGVSVHAAAVAVMDVAVKATCSSGEGPQAGRMNSVINKTMTFFLISIAPVRQRHSFPVPRSRSRLPSQ